ncbi:hypothetical protein AAAC05_36005 [Pseudomonas aeruginosa]|uniref:hypothetical protein n=1 Tax=Pseudomonas aeruginosa TaxID=287 RepID=UPI0030F2C5F9
MLVSHRRPTEEAYAELQAAYDFYNDHLFASQERLPACLITYQREKRTMGYFSQARFIRRDGIKADEIGVVSRKPRNFRQPINMACLALGR